MPIFQGEVGIIVQFLCGLKVSFDSFLKAHLKNGTSSKVTLLPFIFPNAWVPQPSLSTKVSVVKMVYFCVSSTPRLASLEAEYKTNTAMYDLLMEFSGEKENKLLFYEEVIKLKIAVSALKVKLYKKRMWLSVAKPTQKLADVRYQKIQLDRLNPVLLRLGSRIQSLLVLPPALLSFSLWSLMPLLGLTFLENMKRLIVEF
ncbi:Complement component 1 Q subcomponent-binding protein, mitochondrial [Manis javanica]|nr:Complement component 1 Q subcomponent-binding protein, mitochondrial [Manis javanica]